MCNLPNHGGITENKFHYFYSHGIEIKITTFIFHTLSLIEQCVVVQCLVGKTTCNRREGRWEGDLKDRGSELRR